MIALHHVFMKIKKNIGTSAVTLHMPIKLCMHYIHARYRVNIPGFMHGTHLCQIDINMTNN